MQGQQSWAASPVVTVCVMEVTKPVIDPKTLRTAVVIAVPMIIGILEVLQAYQGKVTLSDPGFWIKMVQIVGAGLFGKEALTGSNDVRLDQLPLEWQGKTDLQ